MCGTSILTGRDVTIKADYAVVLIVFSDESLTIGFITAQYLPSSPGCRLFQTSYSEDEILGRQHQEAETIF